MFAFLNRLPYLVFVIQVVSQWIGSIASNCIPALLFGKYDVLVPFHKQILTFGELFSMVHAVNWFKLLY